jgi:hypothetical protein
MIIVEYFGGTVQEHIRSWVTPRHLKETAN